MRLETRRLFLTTPDEAPVEAVCQYLVSNRQFLAPWEPSRSQAYFELASQISILEKQKDQFRARTEITFYLQEKGSLEVVGSASFSQVVYGPFQPCFLGYRLSQTLEGRGLMTEALQDAIRWVFEALALHRIEANVMPRNGASKRVLEKLGFVSEGSSRKYLKINGVWEDHEHYVLLNETVE